ncbi:MAG: hypothetical protein LBW77_04375 [Verrucomicrobiota bacterium]|jgi:hypothetical protein|nr:hypothetical protein [Verrucomicrobiota bacterium]
MIWTFKPFARASLAGIILAGASLSLLPGCRPSAEKAAAREAQLNSEVEQTLAKAQALNTEGKGEAAVKLLDRALANRKYAARKPAFFSEKIRLLLAQDNLPAARDTFDACVAQLPDDPLLKLARSAFSALQKSGKTDLLDQVSKALAFSASGKTNSVNYAARVWTECGVSADKKALPERLSALLAGGVSPEQVGTLFDRYFYELTDQPDIIRSLCALGEKLLAVCRDKDTVNAVKVKVLDGAFITEDYDLAVAMLEKGIPGKDPAWHAMSIPKVKAHRALAKNQPREAAGFFRDFMNAWIASDQQEEFDPISGVAYSREWILGRNAKRIAGILDTIPDKAEADKARAEAAAYFKTALEKAASDPAALKLLKEEAKAD